MKKKYIEPNVVYKNVILDDLVCLSMVDDPETPAKAGEDPDRESDGLVKGENLWDEEW